MHKSVANVDAPCLYPNSHVHTDVVVVEVAVLVVVLVTVLVVEDVTVLVVEDVTDVVVDVVGKCVHRVQSGLQASRFDLSTVGVP